MNDFSRQYRDMDLLRFTTAGSVDDGKSTLIGRLLYDSKSIFEDQMEAIQRASEKSGDDYVNLALLTDGLRAEREQGITIDVAYRYFATPKRKFIIADTPGHVQYTRNMVTGASTADLALILVDARAGMVEQTCRHAIIASLLGIPHIIFCINKMDLVDYSESVFLEIQAALEAFTSKLQEHDIHYIPISALRGDNVVDRSENMDWYGGPTLLYTLENIHVSGDYNHVDQRFPVQYVIRPQSLDQPDFRGYAGRVAGGVFRPGDAVMALPSGLTSRVVSVDGLDVRENEAFAPMSATLTLEDDIDISRGDMIVGMDNPPKATQDLDILLCWLSPSPLRVGGKYAVKHTSRDVRCVVRKILYKVDINTLERIERDAPVRMNDIARVSVRTTAPLFIDAYSRNRSTGSLILIDEAGNETVGAGIIDDLAPQA
jgi:sulfate adenylyltransferase subunit 1